MFVSFPTFVLRTEQEQRAKRISLRLQEPPREACHRRRACRTAKSQSALPQSRIHSAKIRRTSSACCRASCCEESSHSFVRKPHHLPRSQRSTARHERRSDKRRTRRRKRRSRGRSDRDAPRGAWANRWDRVSRRSIFAPPPVDPFAQRRLLRCARDGEHTPHAPLECQIPYEEP